MFFSINFSQAHKPSQIKRFLFFDLLSTRDFANAIHFNVENMILISVFGALISGIG